MAIQQWSDEIIMAELPAEPGFSEEVGALLERLEAGPAADVVLNLNEVSNVNSSNISQLLKIRQKQLNDNRRLRLCSVSDNVWGVMMVTGLDKIFSFQPDPMMALASLQVEEGD